MLDVSTYGPHELRQTIALDGAYEVRNEAMKRANVLALKAAKLRAKLAAALHEQAQMEEIFNAACAQIRAEQDMAA